jgi:hypothetical protein
MAALGLHLVVQPQVGSREALAELFLRHPVEVQRQDAPGCAGQVFAIEVTPDLLLKTCNRAEAQFLGFGCTDSKSIPQWNYAHVGQAGIP